KMRTPETRGRAPQRSARRSNCAYRLRSRDACPSGTVICPQTCSLLDAPQSVARPIRPFRGPLYRQLARLFAVEKANGVDAGQTVSVRSMALSPRWSDVPDRATLAMEAYMALNARSSRCGLTGTIR